MHRGSSAVDLKHLIVVMIGLIFGAIGIKAIVTRKITLYTSFQWNGSTSDLSDDRADSGATTELSGIGAVLVGIAHLALGVGFMIKGPAFFH